MDEARIGKQHTHDMKPGGRARGVLPFGSGPRTYIDFIKTHPTLTHRQRAVVRGQLIRGLNVATAAADYAYGLAGAQACAKAHADAGRMCGGCPAMAICGISERMADRRRAALGF